MRTYIALLALALFACVFWAGGPLLAQQESQPHMAAEESSSTEGHQTEGYTSAQWRDFGLRILNFLVYAAILYFLLRKPISKFFKGRKENISRTLEYLETQAKNLEEQTKVMRRKLDDLNTEREQVLLEYEKAGAKERDRIISEAQKTADLIIERAQVAVEQEIKTARRILTLEAGQLAANLAKELVVNNINDDDRARLAHEFIDQVVKLPARN